MNQLLFFSLFATLGLVYLFLGLRASRRVKTDTDYYLANRSLGLLPITCNLIATQLGGGFLLGTAKDAYTYGLYGILYSIGICIGFLLLGCGIAARLQQFKVTTTAQLFETQYQSSLLKKFASVLSIVTMFGILIAQAQGFRSLMGGIGFSSTWLGSLFWLSVVAYTMVGGLRAITINDMVQLAIITTVFGGLFVYTIIADPGSITLLTQQSALFTAQLPPMMELLPIVLMPALFSLFEQDLAQRFFSSQSGHVATLSSLISGLFLLGFAFIPVYFGMKARVMGFDATMGSPLLPFLNATGNDFVVALAICAIVAAIISTADALTNGISANVTQDFNLQWLSFSKLTLSRLVSGIVGTGALIASYYVSESIVDTIIDSYAISVSCLLVPLLYCFFSTKPNTQAALVSCCAGLVGFIGFWLFPIGIPKEFPALGLSWLGYVVVAAQR